GHGVRRKDRKRGAGALCVVCALLGILGPVFRGVAYAENVHLILARGNFVHCDVGPGSENKLSGVRGQAGPSTVGEIAQRGYTLVNGLGNPPGGFGIILTDSLHNAGQVASGVSSPADAGHERSIFSIRSTTSSCSSKSPRR